MPDREVNIPKVLHELHGERARASSLILVYLTGTITALLFILNLLPAKLTLWQYILVGILMMDIAGGIVANLSTSTNQYYQRKKSLRLPFLALHVLQPLGFYIAFPQHFCYFAFLCLYTLTLSLLVNALEDSELQQNLAAAVLVVGIICSVFFQVDYAILYAVAPMYMTKLLVGFSVRRPSFI